MQILTGLAELITDLRPGYLKSFDPMAFHDRDPMFLKFLRGLLGKKYRTDEEAAKALFGGKPDRKYNKLKNEVKEVLIQQVFQLDIDKRARNLRHRMTYNYKRDFLAASFLELTGAVLPAYELMKNINEKAQAAEMNDLIYLSARHLRNSSFMREGINKIKFYSGMMTKALNTLHAEAEAEQLYQEITFLMSKEENEGFKYLSRAKKNFEKMERILEAYSSPIIIHNQAKLKNRVLFLQKDNKGIIENANIFLRYLDQRPLYKTSPIKAEFILYKLQSYIQLRDYQNGMECVNECVQYYRSGSSNWLIFLEFYLELCMHTENYAQALNIFYEVINHPKYETFFPERKERFKIFEAYLNYILPHAVPKETFDLFKFTEETPVYAQDKSGNFLTVIIAQFILLVEINRYDMIKEKEADIRFYLGHHVDKKVSPRTWYFFNMMLEMIRQDFDPQQTEAASRKWFDKIDPAKNPSLANTESIEVMPYDILWLDLLVKLKRNSKQ